MSQSPSDFRSYATLPVLDVRRAVALSRALQAAAPEKMSRLARRALKQVAAATEALEEAWLDVQPARKSNTRAADSALDHAWGALRDRLSAWRRLPHLPQAVRSAALDEALFPTGLDFLLLPYDRQWAESEHRLKRIDQDQLSGELDDLASPEFLVALRQAHDLYGEALGITSPREEAVSQITLRSLLLTLRAALNDWTLRLIGTTDDEDPDAVAALKAAFRPIDELRANLSRASSAPVASPEADPEPT